jgi:hypothetical protein
MSTSGSQSNSQVLMKQIFTSWALDKHPELSNAQPSNIEISINGTGAICTMYFLTPQKLQYIAQFRMDLTTNAISELSFTRTN